jgi:hypothetical protein
VPPEWRVESSLTAIAGGVDVRQGAESSEAPTLTIDGRALFGGIAVGARAPNSDDEEPAAT